MNQPFLINTTLAERQMLYNNASHCPYCSNQTVYVDSKEVYRDSHGMIYICRPCKAWVGVHHGNTDQAYGFVAKKELRELRHLTHKWFDGLWQKKVKMGTTRKQAQILARKWLANFLDIEIVECHIGMFTEELCQRTIEECKKYYPTQDEKVIMADIEKNNSDVVINNSSNLGYQYSEFNFMGSHHFEIKHPSMKGRLYYYPKNNSAGFSLKSIEILDAPIEDILNELFKTQE